MKIIKKYTAIQLSTSKVNDEVKVNLSYGDVTGPYYNLIYPKEEFDTEDEAYEYAYKKNQYSNWLIVPIIRFNDY
jgi:hypothetical protein